MHTYFLITLYNSNVVLCFSTFHVYEKNLFFLNVVTVWGKIAVGNLQDLGSCDAVWKFWLQVADLVVL